jgi:hypothetical protein
MNRFAQLVFELVGLRTGFWAAPCCHPGSGRFIR